jgi:hypothetical protein
MILNMMLALKKGSNSLYFGCKQVCIKHVSPIAIDHIELCGIFEGFGGLRDFFKKLRDQNIRD